MEKVIPVFQNDTFYIVDAYKNLLSIIEKEEIGWKMLALSGGQPIHIFGQWDGKCFEPFSAVLEGSFHLLQDIKPLERPKNQWNRW